MTGLIQMGIFFNFSGGVEWGGLEGLMDMGGYVGGGLVGEGETLVTANLFAWDVFLFYLLIWVEWAPLIS